MHSAQKIINGLIGLGSLSLLPVNYRDEPFLKQLFLSCRPHLAQIPMPQAFVYALVQQQYELQRSDYGQKFPGYLNLLVLHRHEPIGNLKLHRESQAEFLHVLDVGFLPEHRGQGHGGSLLRALQALSAQNEWVLRLSVDRQNWRAKKLYSALHFRVEKTSETHHEMIWALPVCVG